MGRRKKSKLKLKLRPETVHSIVALILIMLGLLVVISFTGQGAILAKVNALLQAELGTAMLFLPFVFVSAGMVMFKTKWMWSKPHVLLGTILMFLGTLGGLKSGDIGLKTFANVANLLSAPGSYVVFVTIFAIGLLIISQTSIADFVELFGKIKGKSDKSTGLQPATSASDEEIAKSRGFSLPKLSFGRKKPADLFADNSGDDAVDDVDDLLKEGGVGTAVVSPHGQPGQPSQPGQPAAGDNEGVGTSLSAANVAQQIWEYPPLSLLSNARGASANRGDVKENASIIEKTFRAFNVGAELKELNRGPAVTQYAMKIDEGTKLSKITSLSTDLALALAAPGGQIRIEAPIPGKALVGIEIPNFSPENVTLRQMLSHPEMKKNPSKLAVALGLDVAGKPVTMDISELPHLLVAGATGSGKSVAINTFLCSVLFRASPDEVKMILIDPKRVELNLYDGIPHLYTPVIHDADKVVSALRWATKEMENRYKKLNEVQVREIRAYNELSGYSAMPHILIVIDELADLMIAHASEVEESIIRIAQLARAVGIHLVLATQRPSVDVITGLIKANIPGRIAFNVSSMTDSRVVLDTPGAEKLLGKGDMLYLHPNKSKPMRVQGTFVTPEEIKSLVEFIKSQGRPTQYAEEITTKYVGVPGAAGNNPGSPEARDPLFDEVVKFVAREGKGTASSIQRRFSIGFTKAGRILDQMQAAGMVEPQIGSKSREIHLQVILQYLKSKEQRPQ